jgi:hypothetical protein
MTNILLSYPRSGNHLTRFFIELLMEEPTFGCDYNKEDVPIYQNKFKNDLPFNININNINNCYYKYHEPPTIKCSNLIFIIRNPKEVLLRHSNNKINTRLFDIYFNCINFYINFNGNKIIFFYEDMITDKINFINKLYEFLKCKNKNKLDWVLNNIDLLYNESLNGTNRSWGGVNSDSINYYYPKITNNIKNKFDIYLYNKLLNPNYQFIINKYNIIFEEVL